MDIRSPFESEICFVLDSLKARIEEYPPDIRTLGLGYLDRMHLRSSCTVRTCESYILIPFWLRDFFGLDIKTCRRISLATIFSVLYFMTQDEIMDASSECSPELIPLSSMFYYDFIHRYHRIFPHSSSFWESFSLYFREWSHSILWEKTHHLGKITPFSPDDFILLARKTAGIKIPFAAVSILAKQEKILPCFTEMVDYDQVVYQFYDDWRDLEKDFEKGNYTHLIVEAVKYLQLDLEAINGTLLKAARLHEEFFTTYFFTAYQYYRLSQKAIEHLDIPYMKAYLEEEASHCILSPLRSLYSLNKGYGSLLEETIFRMNDGTTRHR